MHEYVAFTHCRKQVSKASTSFIRSILSHGQTGPTKNLVSGWADHAIGTGSGIEN